MTQPALTHRYYDIEVEPFEESARGYLVKILALDGRRFTYLVQGDLDEAAVAYVKTMIDLGVLSDMMLEWVDGEWRADAASIPLKKHG